MSTSEQSVTPTLAPHAAPKGSGWWKQNYHRLHNFDHDKFARRARKYDSHVYGIVVAIGVPLMSLIPDSYTKLVIASVWCITASLLFWWLEGMEINAQITKYGLLDQAESDSQRKTMYFLYVGVAIALVVWIVALGIHIGVHIVTMWSQQDWWGKTVFVFWSPFTTPIRYGTIQWGILVHTLLVAYFSIDVYYPLMSNFLQATAGQKRVERETVTVVPDPHTHA